LPQLEGLALGGTFALDSRVRFDTKIPKEPEVEWNFDNRCEVKETPAPIDPDRFREPFQHVITDAAGSAMEMSTGPTTEQWVPFAEIPKAMETALIVCEDSRFFTHDGFDNKAIRDSIIDNLRAGRFVRGASTLSMQLAKNLYLGREKTLSRKLQEAAFTLLLEERLNKQEIMELYLNVVEFAPGVYGIRNAARHYFNAHPGELSLGQALFLGSILPSPKANHFGPDKALRPRWAQHLQYLMRIAHKIKRITDEELAAGLNERIIFGEPHPTTDSDFLFGTPLYQVEGG
jgi:membrane peptidoglycan carboxypeptidase